MNTLFLIGNGFDLAHGHKTKYADFIYWYLNQIIDFHYLNKHYEDDLIKIPFGIQTRNLKITNSSDIKEFNQLFTPAYKHEFIRKIVSQFIEVDWVDIEEEYYSFLKVAGKVYKSERGYLDAIVSLNKNFDTLKRKLTDYLKFIQGDFTKSESLKKIIDKELIRTLPKALGTKKQNLFLNFNYTNLIKSYMDEDFTINSTLINIHGELLNDKNPIIFGYGAEIDSNYEEIENLNENKFLDFIKSFGYSLTENYRTLMRFIDFTEYKVVILGHSCGLSDRVFLNEIFENLNCKEIKIYYHKYEGGNDFVEKVQNISRHFKKEHKSETRRKIVSFEESVPLI